MKFQSKSMYSLFVSCNKYLLRAMLFSFLLNSGLSLAATITVDAVDGLVSDNGECSLVEAVNAANNDVASGSMPGECTAGESGLDTIVLATDVTISNAAVSNLNGNSALPVINSEIIIDGNGYSLQRNNALACNADEISDATEFRLIEIGSGSDLSLKNIILANGCVYSESPVGAGKFSGGAVFNEGNLSIEDSVLQNNRAYRGGAIHNEGHIYEISNSVVSGNAAYFSGGAVYIHYYDTIDLIQNSVFENNSSIYSGGSAIDNNGTITTITQSTFHLNQSDGGGSGAVIHNDEIIVTIENTTFSENKGTAGSGTAFWQATSTDTTNINNCTFSANEAAYGGIIFNRGAIVLTNSIFHNHVGILDCYSQSGSVSGSQNISTQDNSYDCVVSIASNLTPNTVGPLQDNGCINALADGSCVKTHALLPGSEALNGASSGTVTDQRGFSVDDGMRDIGAFEGQFEEIDLIFKDGFE